VVKNVVGAAEQITEAVMSLEGVSSRPHRFGGIEFRFGRRELGHLHGNYLLDIPFPMKLRNELVESHRAEPHHILPDSGWVSFTIRKEGDVSEAIGLLKLSLELARKQYKEKGIDI
jgi:hypothetical protein